MPTALDIAANYTGASTTEAQQKTWITSMRAALAEIGDPTARHGAIQNLSLAFSVGSNALTCNVKTRAGATASSTDPVSAAMRNATLATGDFNVRNITAALSLVISSGSTLGHLNATAGFIYWYLIDNAGTLELAASTTYLGVNGIVTTVAEGGAGAADSATVVYSATARSNVPFICVCRTIDTQTTAGTWAAVPTAVQLAPLDDLYQGAMPQNSQSTAYTTILSDANKHIYHPAGDNNARTFTIDSNANVPYPIGTTITFVNEINTVTIAITTDTLVLSGTGATGSRTLAANGQATALKVTSTRWVISGVNLT
jgi:hypothetical protein